MRKIRNLFLTICIIASSSYVVSAQGLSNLLNFKLSDKLELGGGIGASFTNNQLNVSLASVLGIHLHPRLFLGAGVSYQIFTDFSPNQTLQIVGGSLLSRVSVLNNIYFQAEYGHLFHLGNEIYQQIYGKSENRLLFGAGYRVAMGTNLSSYFAILWNVLQNDRSTTQNPIIQAGIGYLF